MKDPIDWPSFGMPEGVEVEYEVQATPIGKRYIWRLSVRDALLVLSRDPHDPIDVAASDVALYVEVLVPPDFPILEAFMRAARAIERGEVEL